LIKEGYFNLNTILNLKSLWMPQVWETSKPEHTNINKGSMHLYDQAKMEINMSEGLVNIELPWHITKCTYWQRIWTAVLEMLQRWRGHICLSMTPPFRCGLKRRRELRPWRLRWSTRLGHTHG
jgi:hypothetical protein